MTGYVVGWVTGLGTGLVIAVEFRRWRQLWARRRRRGRQLELAITSERRWLR